MTNTRPIATAQPADTNSWDTGSNAGFFRYYEQQSLSPATLERFRTTTETLVELAGDTASRRKPLEVLDIGCGAGAQGQFWLKEGHRYRGLDINRPLVELARERFRAQGLDAEFEVGSATALPYGNETTDICVLPFILEHVVDWQSCLDEALRVLRPGGLIFVSTTNRLCPVQDEFDLPMYGWYPGWLKRRFEQLAVTTRPELVGHAKYPAVNWFSVYQLGAYLRAIGCCQVYDRFDLFREAGRGWKVRAGLRLVRSLPPARWLAQVCTPYSLVVGRKQPRGEDLPPR